MLANDHRQTASNSCWAACITQQILQQDKNITQPVLVFQAARFCNKYICMMPTSTLQQRMSVNGQQQHAVCGRHSSSSDNRLGMERVITIHGVMSSR